MDADLTAVEAAVHVEESIRNLLWTAPGDTPVSFIAAAVEERAADLRRLVEVEDRESSRMADMLLAVTPGRVTYRRRPATWRARCSNAHADHKGESA